MQASEYHSMFQLENEYWWYRTLHDLVLSSIARLGRRDLRILDAGCGTGRVMELLGEYGTTDGVDASEAGVKYCGERGLERAVHADLNQWRGKSGEYDVVVSLDVICCGGIEDDLSVVSAFHDSLRQGGTLIINVPAFEILRRDHDIVVETKRRYRRKIFSERLRAIGFNVETATYRLPALFMFLLAKLPARLFRASDSVATSDLATLPKTVNWMLYALHRLENKLISSGARVPFGSSLFVVATKA